MSVRKARASLPGQAVACPKPLINLYDFGVRGDSCAGGRRCRAAPDDAIPG